MSAISLFKPALEAAASRQGDDPLARSMREALRARCEAHLTPGAEAFIDYETRASEWWARRGGGRVIPRAPEPPPVGPPPFRGGPPRAAPPARQHATGPTPQETASSPATRTSASAN